MMTQTTKIYWLAGWMALLPAMAWGGPASAELSESQCQGSSESYGSSASDVPVVKSCCAYVFKSAQPSAKLDLLLGDIKYSMAGNGRMVCVDQYRVDLAGKGAPKFLRRGLIAGRNTRLKNVSGLSVAGSLLYVSDAEKGNEQVLVFDYTMDGNIFPKREMRPAGTPPSVSIALDEEAKQLILLGQDGKIRMMDSRSHDLSLKEEDHSRIDRTIEPSGSIGNPVSITFSRRLGRFFVLTDDRKVLVFDRNKTGKTAPEATVEVEDLVKPVKIAVRESSDKVILDVDGADGTRVNITYELK